jgi:UDP-glucose 4-epimerase
MKIFLTGGTGFIGSHIAMEMINNGHELTILARNENKVPALKEIKGIKIVQGDLADTKLLEELIPGHDACILVALKWGEQVGKKVLVEDTLPTVIMAGISAEANVKHFIYTSSTAANDHVYMIEENKLSGLYKHVYSYSKQHPSTFYGATKAASENFLLAQSYQSQMRVNFIRPGYTFGNPIIEGGSTEGDTRFSNIVKCALDNRAIKVVKTDGTQFIWAGDLAKLYTKVLNSNVNRKMYFGLAKNFISWETIAKEAIRRTNSKSVIEVEDRGWDPDGTTFDVSDMKNDFGLEFDGWEKIKEHLDYYINLETK